MNKSLLAQKIRNHFINLRLLGIDYVILNKKQNISGCYACAYILGSKKIPKCSKKIIIITEKPHNTSGELVIFNEKEKELLKKMLDAIKLKEEDIHFTTVFKCNNRDGDITFCKRIFEDEIGNLSGLKDNVSVLCFGSLCSLLFFDVKKEMTELRNKVHGFNSLKVVFTLKLDNILNADENTQKELKKTVWNDLKLFKSILKS